MLLRLGLKLQSKWIERNLAIIVGGNFFMIQTERFKLRKKILRKIFTKKDIVKVWRKIVRRQLRNLDIKDLYDHYDFNYNIIERAIAIRNDLLNGKYKVSNALTYRLEKKYGICRHIVALQPTDALVFQVLVEKVSVKALENQPSKNAFYSRDKHSVYKPHDIDEYGLNWRQQWKKMQKKIYHFNDAKKLIVVTDLSNYYDSIDMNELRKVFTSYSKIDEVVIDLIFRIIKGISWLPDYLPYSFKGLPTTNIEGIRLLAHSFLFEIDEILKDNTNNNFARWMDDITFGVDSKKQAIETLSAISDMLKSRGLAINLGKTDIYTAKEGYYHFQIKENRYIDSIETKDIEDEKYNGTCEELYKKFKAHLNLKDTKPKYWSKVAKRYITTHSKLKSDKILKNVTNIYIDYPDLRKFLLIYLENMGYSPQTSEIVLNIINKIDVFDDISLYQICYLVTRWEIPVDEVSKKFLKEFEEYIIKFSFKRKNPFDFYCILWTKAKYNSHENLLRFIKKFQNIWQNDSFLRRQVTAILSRLLVSNSIEVEKLINGQISSGIPNVVTLADQILRFSKLENFDKNLSLYLFPEKKQRPYPLEKFLVLCSVLNSSSIRTKKNIKKNVLEHIEDSYYLRWLDLQYDIN